MNCLAAREENSQSNLGSERVKDRCYCFRITGTCKNGIAQYEFAFPVNGIIKLAKMREVGHFHWPSFQLFSFMMVLSEYFFSLAWVLVHIRITEMQLCSCPATAQHKGGYPVVRR